MQRNMNVFIVVSVLFQRVQLVFMVIGYCENRKDSFDK